MSAPWSACFRETSCPFSDLLKSWLAISIVNFVCHSMSSLKMFAVIVTLYFVLLSSSTSYHLPNLWFSYHGLFFLAYQVCRSAKSDSTKWAIIWFGKHTFWWSGFAIYPSSGEYVLKFMVFFSFVHNRLSKWISHPFAHDLELSVRDICSFASRPGLMQPWKSRYQKICSWCILISIGETWMILFLPYWNWLLVMTAL